VLEHESNSICIFKLYIYADYYHRGNKENRDYRDFKPLQCFDFVQPLMEHDSSNVPFDLAMKASLTRIKD